jgi:hypothetical protein
MSIRTTDEAVAGIIEVDELIPLTPFIETASSLVDDIAAASSSVSAARLELIERYLSAHFYTLRDPRPTAERAGPVSTNYQSSVGPGLKTSHYGQMAITLDPTGTLLRMSNGRRIGSVTWLGVEADRGLAEDT